MRAVFGVFNRWLRRCPHLAPEASSPRAFVRWMHEIGEVSLTPLADWHAHYLDVCSLTAASPCSAEVFWSEVEAALRVTSDAEIVVVAALVRLRARGQTGVTNDELAAEMRVTKGEASKRRSAAAGCTRVERDGKFVRIYLIEPLTASSSGAQLAPAG